MRVLFVRILVFQSQKEIPNKLVRPAGYNIITKENWVGSLEKAIDVPGEKLTEMKTDIDFIKDLLLQMNK